MVEGESAFVSFAARDCVSFEMMLTSKKLQSHSEAEEGVRIGLLRDRKGSALAVTYSHQDHCLNMRATWEQQISILEQHTQRLQKCTTTTEETLIWAD